MKHITHHELKKWGEENRSFQLIDVRQPYEHRAYNIGGKLIPLRKFIQQIEDLPTEVPVVIYCAKGIRSQLAIQRALKKHPYTNLYNLKGGISALKA